MKIALVQFDTLWEDKETNLNYVSEKITSLLEDVDLVVLPEMFSTGFTMTPNLVAEVEEDITLKTVQNLAYKCNVAITGSWIVKEGTNYYNRLFFVFPDKSYKTYNKRHLFTLAGEEKVYTAGTEKLIVEYKGWKICPLVCYDLRFPVYSRIENENYDVMIYVASWPDKRMLAWDSLLRARAIENMSYVIAVNRCGTDPTNVYYSGHSQAIDYMGNYLQEPFLHEDIKIVEIDKDALQKARTKFAFLNDADKFEIKK